MEEITNNGEKIQAADAQDNQTRLFATNKPVVEAVGLVQARQTLTRDDLIEVRMKEYDADREIQAVYVNVG